LRYMIGQNFIKLSPAVHGLSLQQQKKQDKNLRDNDEYNIVNTTVDRPEKSDETTDSDSQISDEVIGVSRLVPSHK